MTETKTKAGETKVKHGSAIEALVAFQGEMKTVGKDKVNPHFKSRYADIASITEEVAPLLSRHGLAFSCQPRAVGDGTSGYEIVGKLLHESGSYLEGSLPLFGQDAQKIGSSITYARRYLLGALTGVVTGDEADDDGNMASTTNERARREPVSRAAAVPTKSPEEIVTEMLATTNKQTAVQMWTTYNLDGAPKHIQDQVRSHIMGLSEE